MKKLAFLLFLVALVAMVPTGCGKEAGPAGPSHEDIKNSQTKGPAPASKAAGHHDVTLLYWGSAG